MSDSRPPNGFTLVEVLVALVVTSLLLVIVMDGAIGARQRARAAVDRAEATLLARDVLARASTARFEHGIRGGAGPDGRLNWIVAETASESDPRNRFVLAEIRVNVRGPAGNDLLSITTRRLKPVVEQ